MPTTQEAIRTGDEFAGQLTAHYRNITKEEFPKENSLAREMIAALKVRFEMTMAEYSQYKNHWDGWVLGRIKTPIKFTSGANLLRGDYVLVQPTTQLGLYLDWEVSVWSPRANHGLMVNIHHVDILTW